jgi:hypothetical protein
LGRRPPPVQRALFGNLYHQGTVYEASGLAVPFLLELLGLGGTPERAWLMYYLAHVACGSSYHDVHQWLSFNEQRRGTPELQAQVALELGWVKAAHLAVCEGLPTFAALTVAECLLPIF